jgi:hypothetical protein
MFKRDYERAAYQVRMAREAGYKPVVVEAIRDSFIKLFMHYKAFDLAKFMRACGPVLLLVLCASGAAAQEPALPEGASWVGDEDTCVYELVTVFPELHAFAPRRTWIAAYNPQQYPVRVKFRLPQGFYRTWFSVTLAPEQRWAFDVTSIVYGGGGFALEVLAGKAVVTATSWDTTNGIYSQPFTGPSTTVFRSPCTIGG